jgi:dipeptidyl aminopeptidase/acylaminoacyl peptidase
MFAFNGAPMRVLALLILACILSRIAYADSIAARRLVEVADFSDPVVSPDGRKVAFRVERASIERNAYDSDWYVQDVDGASLPRRVADGGVPLRDPTGNSTPGLAVWSSDGRWIFYRALMDGRVEVWRAASDGSDAEPVTHDQANVRAFSLSHDGRHLKYSVGATRDDTIIAERAEYDRGIRIDESVPIGQGVYHSGYVDGRLATLRFTGTWFELRPFLGNAPGRWKAVDLATGAERDLAPFDVPPVPLPASEFSNGSDVPWKLATDPDSGRIAMLTRVGKAAGEQDKPEVVLSVLLSGKARQATKCLDIRCTNKAITDIQWRSGSGEVLFTVTDPNEGNAQSIFRWNVDTGIVRPVVQAHGLVGGGGRYSLGSCGASPAVLLCVTSEVDQPPRLERIDLETGERQVLFDPNAALAQDLVKEAPARLLRWSDNKGRHFTGQYFPARRNDGTLPPVFIVYYSCDGFVRGGVGDEFPFSTFPEDGIAALCINRLEGFTLDAVERHDEGRAAAESAVNLLASRGEIDRTKVGMGGLSFGGAVALWTATESKLLAAVSVSSPVVTPNYYLFNSLRGTGFIDELKTSWGLGAPDETPERWRALSPAFKLDMVSAPILFQNSESEYLYGLEYAVPLMRAHRADLYVFPNEPHLKYQPRHKLAVYERNIDWFRFWLQGIVDPDPEKVGQYAHWKQMKAAMSGDFVDH